MSNYTPPVVQGTRNPSQTLRDIAAMLARLADDFEAQHTRQNNDLGAALGNAELGMQNQIDDLVARVAAIEQSSRELRGANGVEPS